MGERIFKTLKEWRAEIRSSEQSERVQLVEKRPGQKTMKVDGLLYHSQYAPHDEAKHFVESANLDSNRPVIVIGLGLGYHIRELLKRDFKVLVIEPDKDVFHSVLNLLDLPDELNIASSLNVEELLQDPVVRQVITKVPQPLFHPVTAKLHSSFCEQFIQSLSRVCLDQHHLNIAVVGPMYGGSLPIAKYLYRALQKLGHNTVFINPETAYSLYCSISKTIKAPKITRHLEDYLTQFLSDWCYAQVLEFQPEICIVMAQAPVVKAFPVRLSEKNIITAFWFVENWRHLSYWKDIAPFYDIFFHIQPYDFDKKLDSIGCAMHFPVLTGCDPELHRPVTLTPEEEKIYRCDLSFAGAGYYNRIQMLKGLTDFNLKIWGVNWVDEVLLPYVVEGIKGFDTEEYMKIVAGTKINLNLHSSVIHEGVDPEADAINPRVFEIASAGGFQLCDPCKGLENLFDTKDEIPTYTDLKSLRSKIEYYLAHEDERKEIAQRARARAHREHTYQHRANQMLDFIKEYFGGKIMRKGLRIRRTVGEVIELLEDPSPLKEWLKTLPTDLPFTQEDINKHLPILNSNIPLPAQVFWFLNEVRVFGEQLLRER